ncbi:MAG: PEP-CTERM sorting domain-containing protein [Bryobacteraceae bacterium]
MKTDYFALLTLAAAVAFAPAALGDGFNFSFSGGGINASGVFWVGQQSTNSATPPGYEITGINGTFSDTNKGVSGAITGLYTPISYVSNTLATPGIAHTSGGLSYDDLLYPAGDSPLICYDINSTTGLPELTYPFSGGRFDIFGVAFNIAGPGGYVGELWSNGDVGGGPIVYAAGLANATSLVDDPNAAPGPGVPPPGRYGSFSTSPVPEPGSLLLLGIGLLGLAAMRARQSKRGRSEV